MKRHRIITKKYLRYGFFNPYFEFEYVIQVEDILKNCDWIDVCFFKNKNKAIKYLMKIKNIQKFNKK